MSRHYRTAQSSFDSQFSVSFCPLMLSDTKRAEILLRAGEILALRNEMSEVFFQNMLAWQDMSKFEAHKHFTALLNDRLSSHYLKMAITPPEGRLAVWLRQRTRYYPVDYVVYSSG